jgi:hypothetical protein
VGLASVTNGALLFAYFVGRARGLFLRRRCTGGPGPAPGRSVK